MVGIRHGAGPDHIGILRLAHQLSRLLFRRLLGRHRPAITGPIFLEQIAFPLHDGTFNFGRISTRPKAPCPRTSHTFITPACWRRRNSANESKMGFPAIPIGATLP